MKPRTVDEKDHPFPNKELNFIVKINKEQKLDIEEIALISQLLHKYLDLRAEVFHEF